MSEPDGVAEAFGVMADAAERVAEESHELALQSRKVGAEHVAGASAAATVASGRPQAMLKLAESLARSLISAASLVRRALVRQLASEGKGVSAISRFFGVSHQRISVLLKARHQDD